MCHGRFRDWHSPAPRSQAFARFATARCAVVSKMKLDSALWLKAAVSLKDFARVRTCTPRSTDPPQLISLPLSISCYDPITSGAQNSAILVCSIYALLVGRCLVCSFPVKRLQQEMIVFGRNVNVQRWQLSRKSAWLGLGGTYPMRILCVGISWKGASESTEILCGREILLIFYMPLSAALSWQEEVR